MLAHHHQFLMLIKSLHELHHQAKSGLLMFLFFLNSNSDPQRVPNEHRVDKTQTIISIGHGQFIHGPGRQPDGDAKNKGAVRDPSLERLRLTPLFVHMMGEKIAGLSGVEYDIRLGKRPTGSVSFVVNCKVFKM